MTGKVKIVDSQLVPRQPEEMKDSGVEWLGMIPKEWKKTKVKYLANKIGSGKTPRGGSESYSTAGITFLRSQNIHNDGIYLDDVVYVDTKTDREMRSTRVRKGDILLNITGASIGRCALFDFDIDANVNQHVCIVRIANDSKIVRYIMLSNVVNDQIMSLQTGSSREGLNFEQVGDLAIVLPKVQIEIDSILKLLDEKCFQIDNTIKFEYSQITLLKSAKQSLISEAVTGKIDLRDWEINEQGGAS